MGTPFLNTRQSTEDIKKVIKPHKTIKTIDTPKKVKEINNKEPHLPIRGR